MRRPIPMKHHVNQFCSTVERPFRERIRVLFALTAAALLAWSSPVSAQQFNIATNPSITSCSGVLEDSGGPAGQYGNNENFLTVICPDVPGDVISLTWVVFDLSLTGPNPPDRIRIWDGDNTGATFVGEYTGTDLAALTTQASPLNPSGCLTIQFISNANGTGNFAAALACETPCDRPTAEGTMSEGVPALICVNEVLTFDGSASFPAAGFNIVTYTWDFADGTTANTPVTSHSWSEPGEYMVQLYVVDDNGCGNSNLLDLQVLVSTTPSFQGTTASMETCLGAVVDLSAVVTPTTWTGVPQNNFGPPVYLPDNLGIPFTSDILFTQFTPGQTLTDAFDILSVCVDMEHSFMGDLVISMTCPNGQSITFHQQGGGGTDLGIPGPGNQQGTCWNYCWSPTATNGTWVANAGPGSLPAGTYQSLQPFSNLVGCPLNGTWTITFIDLWAADDGWLCGWNLNINPSIIPDVTEFTPVLGTSVQDSAFWAGPFLTTDPSNPLLATATPNVPGTFNYTFTVTDNFGCSYDTTIAITVAPQMEIDAGPDIILCTDPENMAGQIVANGPPSNCVWQLQLLESFGDGWNGGANLQVIIDGVSTTYTIANAGVNQLNFNLNVTTGQSIVLQYTAGTVWNNENSFRLFDDQGNLVYQSQQGPPTGIAWSGTISCGGGTTPVVWQWSPATGLANISDPTTSVYVTQPTWFTLSAWPLGSPECAVTDSVLVAPDPSIDAGGNNDLIVCANEPAFDMTASLNGTPDAGGVWTTAGGVVMSGTFVPGTTAPGTYTYTVTSAAGCIATAELTITVIPADDPSCCGVLVMVQPPPSCTLNNTLSVTPGNTGTGFWSGPPGAVIADPFATTTTVSMPVGSGGAHWFYWIEDDQSFCYLIDSVQVVFSDAIQITFNTTDAICYTYCDGTAQASITGGNAAGGYAFAWSNGAAGIGVDAIDNLCAGQYNVLVIDDNGCNATANFTITEPPLLEIDQVITTPVTCAGDCDGTITIICPTAVEYSFDNGVQWSPSSLLPAACEGVYFLQVRNVAGCIGTGGATITGPPPVEADFVWNPIPANVNNPTIFFTNTSENADRYEWDFGGLGTSTLVDPVFVFPNNEPGMYTVCLAAFNFNECPDTVCHFITIDDVLFTYVPNAFTPDADGVNDGFRMSANIPVITNFSMVIFDRWGQEVFSTTDYNEAWLGSYRNSGPILPTGVYVYRILYEIRETQARKELMGSVTLLK